MVINDVNQSHLSGVGNGGNADARMATQNTVPLIAHACEACGRWTWATPAD